MSCLLKRNMRGVISAIISNKQMIIREQTGVWACKNAVDLSKSVHV